MERPLAVFCRVCLTRRQTTKRRGCILYALCMRCGLTTRRSVTSDMRRHREKLTYLLTRCRQMTETICPARFSHSKLPFGDADQWVRLPTSGTVSICVSVCFPLAAASRCGGFAAVGPAGRRYRSIGAAVRRRSSTAHSSAVFSSNASSATLSADVGS